MSFNTVKSDSLKLQRDFIIHYIGYILVVVQQQMSSALQLLVRHPSLCKSVAVSGFVDSVSEFCVQLNTTFLSGVPWYPRALRCFKVPRLRTLVFLRRIVFEYR